MQLIHATHLLTYSTKSGTTRIRVRIGSLWSFHGGQVKELVWWRRTHPESPYDDDRFAIYLCRFHSPFYGNEFSSVAYMQSNYYAQVNTVHHHLSGYHGYDNYDLNHNMNFMESQAQACMDCGRFYSDIAHLCEDLEGRTNIACCATKVRASWDDRWGSKTHGDVNDDGGGQFQTNSNKVVSLTLGRAYSPKEIRTTLLTKIMRYHRSILRHMRATNRDYYGEFSEGILDRRTK